MRRVDGVWLGPCERNDSHAPEPRAISGRRALMRLASVIVAVLFVLSACAAPNAAVAPSPAIASTPSSTGTLATTPESTPTPSMTPALTGAPVSREDAIALAQKVVVADATLISAAFGRFADVYLNSQIGQQGFEADRLVWAVEFESLYTICPPDGSACRTPRPGFTTVILDGYTGAWITTFSVSPHGG